ncbi:MAG TPA: hypothetical protein VGB14_10400 [Acidimicrobiales bacterium]
MARLPSHGRSTVARLRVGGGTVVAKRAADPAALANEVEALRLLPPALRPALVAAGGGVVVTEDLGPGPSLADLLLGDDRAAAERGVHAWAGGLGRLLAATLRPGAPPEPVAFGSGPAELAALAGDLGVAVPPGVDDDVARLASTLSAPSPWLAFGPGDTCPDNNRVAVDSVRFFDFEGAGWRHAALEAAYGRAPFCTCWCVAALPPATLASMEAELLAALDPPSPEAFSATIGPAAVSFTVLTAGAFRRFVVAGAPVGPAGRTPCDGRQYVVARLRAVEAEADRLPALAALAARLREAIVARWPSAAALPAYPAFR